MVWRDNLEGHIVRSYWKLDKRPQGGLGCWQAVRRVSDLLQMAETPWKTDFMSKFVPSAIQCGICHTKWESKLGTNVTTLIHPYQPWSRLGKMKTLHGHAASSKRILNQLPLPSVRWSLRRRPEGCCSPPSPSAWPPWPSLQQPPWLADLSPLQVDPASAQLNLVSWHLYMLQLTWNVS